MLQKLGLLSEASKKLNRFFIANFGELYLAFLKPDEIKKDISEIWREPSFNEDLMQQEFKGVDYLPLDYQYGRFERITVVMNSRMS